ncbi:MAG: hypothetical protein BA863_04320 [Desulfovibrio sp. S3730MH75]|nr:MAG: hypothetical protein BA863_04320 [Desulfovibrio sp. S3730MH75]
MKYSVKTLLASLLLLFLSIGALGTMYLPLEDGKNSFEIMESTFDSLRKGITPPFDELKAANSVNLGKSFSANLTFSSRKMTEAATRVLLRNKLMVTPKGRTLKIQGDLGYTLQYLMDDVHHLYFNQNKKIENKYGMSTTQSMFVVDRILKKLAISMRSKRMITQEQLVNKIRLEELVPAYNLRNTPPINIKSGFTYLSIGTFVLLMFTLLWDLANLFFYRTITDVSFLKKMSGAAKLENKAAFIKKQKARKKKAEALAKKAAAATKDIKKEKEDPAKKKAVKSKKPATNEPKTADPTQAEAKPAPKKAAVQKTAVKKDPEPAAKPIEKPASPKKAQPERPKKAQANGLKKAPVEPQKKAQAEASQKPAEKVIPPASNKKSAVKVAPSKPKKATPTQAKPKAAKLAKPAATDKKPAPKTSKTKD